MIQMRILGLRHGESGANAAGLIVSRTPEWNEDRYGLTIQGALQVEETARETLSGTDGSQIVLIAGEPLRHIQTAEVVANVVEQETGQRPEMDHAEQQLRPDRIAPDDASAFVRVRQLARDQRARPQHADGSPRVDGVPEAVAPGPGVPRHGIGLTRAGAPMRARASGRRPAHRPVSSAQIPVYGTPAVCRRYRPRVVLVDEKNTPVDIKDLPAVESAGMLAF